MSLQPLIVGIGSHHGDDQLGWRVVQLLQQEQEDPPGLTTLCCDRSLFDWWHLASSAKQVIFVDALNVGLEPGQVRRLVINRGEQGAELSALSSHGIGLAQAIALGQQLDVLPAQVVIWGAQLTQSDAANPMSVTMEQAARRLANEILELEYGIRSSISMPPV